MNSLNTPFYLTGGTALGRGYFNHRFSDDLDFFVNKRDDFGSITSLIINKLDQFQKEFILLKEASVSSKDFFQIQLKKNDLLLKIDFVNDISVRFGDFVVNDKLGKIDSLENILTNKITALFRYEPKDIADIWIISKNWESVQRHDDIIRIEPLH
ncbi:MAG: nucleotidyl transferase AbiEii/AbiGii toxin family protein [Spirochaetes bacterium]|nr:nucleotidyl transferase AbiEii/AbiGii toxin family protein [Spirochaetota bacterium]